MSILPVAFTLTDKGSGVQPTRCPKPPALDSYTTSSQANFPLTVLKALVAGCATADGGWGAGGAGEGVGVAGAGALHARETGLAPTHICAVPAQGPAEALGTQAAHHLQGAVNHRRQWMLLMSEQESQLDIL